tara:strand:- start:252767 stop:253120 length:354 start_codon:yes stop_codon:yes gene_type:complete
VIGIAELSGINPGGNTSSVFITVLFVFRKCLCQGLFEAKDRVQRIMGGFYRLPYLYLRKIKVTSLAYKEIIFASKQFRKPAFPKTMDAILAGELTIVIFCTVKRYIDVPQIVTKVCG